MAMDFSTINFGEFFFVYVITIDVRFQTRFYDFICVFWSEIDIKMM